MVVNSTYWNLELQLDKGNEILVQQEYAFLVNLHTKSRAWREARVTRRDLHVSIAGQN